MGRAPVAEARRFRDIIRGYEAEFETANDFDGSLIKEAAFLALKAENLQARHLLEARTLTPTRWCACRANSAKC